MSQATITWIRRTHERRRPDHYRTLGVRDGASLRDIEIAYWDCVRGIRSRDELPELNQAYEVLALEERRRAYDAERERARLARAGLPERRRARPAIAPRPKLWPLVAGGGPSAEAARSKAALAEARESLGVAKIISLRRRA